MFGSAGFAPGLDAGGEIGDVEGGNEPDDGSVPVGAVEDGGGMVVGDVGDVEVGAVVVEDEVEDGDTSVVVTGTVVEVVVDAPGEDVVVDGTQAGVRKVCAGNPSPEWTTTV